MIINSAKATRAAEILGVSLQELTPDALSKAYREKAREHHPDSADTFDQQKWAGVSWAKEVLVRWLEQRTATGTPVGDAERMIGDCRACGGVGRVQVANPRGFGSKGVSLQCVMCEGTGSAEHGAEQRRSRHDAN